MWSTFVDVEILFREIDIYPEVNRNCVSSLQPLSVIELVRGTSKIMIGCLGSVTLL